MKLSSIFIGFMLYAGMVEICAKNGQNMRKNMRKHLKDDCPTYMAQVVGFLHYIQDDKTRTQASIAYFFVTTEILGETVLVSLNFSK